ncbi:WD40-repeat-containing domain protein [Suillus placidus]|uniref:WD40-repeat-containing domain protein n=1 Tax=Suillus placidus TaxID=48579 RepID=A0A9P7A2L8_9AGAM|nr:WD40-repeat-containing domain protein [Suillus placidus]
MTSGSFAKPTVKEASTPAQSKIPTPRHKFEGHEKEIWGFVFLHDNIHIVSGSVDGTMRKWNCDTGLAVGKPWKSEGGRIYTLALSPDGKMIACGREDGSVQRWTTDGEMIKDVWTGHDDRVRSLSWSPSGVHIASGSEDGTILIRGAESGKVEVGPIKTEQGGVWSLAFSSSGERIASGGSYRTICIWNAQTGELVVGPIEDLVLDVTSLVWSSDNTKLYSASDKFARVFDSKTGELLHCFKHGNHLWSIALSPKHNVLACVGTTGVAQLWDTESHQPLGKPFHQNYDSLCYVSFSRDGSHLAYAGSDNKITLWMVKDIAPQLPSPTLLQKSDGRSAQQETGPNSPPSSCVDADATGGGGFIEEAHDDPYNNFFQSSQQSLPSASPGSCLPNLFSARRFWKGIFRCRPPPDESVPQERSKRKFFVLRARSDSPLELATIEPNQPVPEGKVGEGDGNGEDEQGDNVDDRASMNGSLSARKDKGKQRDDPPADAQGPSSYDRTLSVHLNRKNSQKFWERLVQARDKNHTVGSLHSSTRLAQAPQLTLQPWHWNSSLFPVESSRCPIDVAACRDEDRHGIAPESDAEAAAAMLRTNDDVADSSTLPGQPAAWAQASQGRLTQTQASTSRPEEIAADLSLAVVVVPTRISHEFIC